MTLEWAPNWSENESSVPLAPETQQSGGANRLDREHVLASGFVEHVVKPIDAELPCWRD